MRQYVQEVSPQQKLMAVNNNFGNPGMAHQQGSTIEVFDSVLLEDNTLNYTFFKNAGSKVFPFANLPNDGRLQPMESFVLENAYFAVASQDQATGVWQTIEGFNIGNFPGFAMGEMEVFIVNNRVMRPIPLKSFFPDFNKDADSSQDTVKLWDTQIVIPPLQEFRVDVKFPPGFFTAAQGIDTYLFLTLGGPGGLFAPKSNF